MAWRCYTDAMGRYKEADNKIAREIAASDLIIANVTIVDFVGESNQSVWDNIKTGILDGKDLIVGTDASVLKNLVLDPAIDAVTVIAAI